ncbi:MAG TPA: heme-binding domain-containing protein [Anaerolineales bacterium]|nr:heme-binding domain-containing protein [Anaerolineales bacterium]
MNIKKILLYGIAALAGLFLLIQLVPFGRDHTNPAVQQEPNWDSPQTRELAVRACYDCHSNETVWPWYSNIAPVSWIVQDHVLEGREKLNFSEYGIARSETGEGEGEGDEYENEGYNGRHEQEDVEEMVEEIERGNMPLQDYLLMHPNANLTAAEKEALIAGLEATFGK